MRCGCGGVWGGGGVGVGVFLSAEPGHLLSGELLAPAAGCGTGGGELSPAAPGSAPRAAPGPARRAAPAPSRRLAGHRWAGRRRRSPGGRRARGAAAPTGGRREAPAAVSGNGARWKRLLPALPTAKCPLGAPAAPPALPRRGSAEVLADGGEKMPSESPSALFILRQAINIASPLF